jgi:succinate dehydrogenase / fumarate reductase membrane anchor subunit
MKEEKSFRSALGRVRGLGAAKGGTHHWWLQRVTALALIPLMFYLLNRFFTLVVPDGYDGAVKFLHSPIAATAMVLFLAAGFHHAASGLQVVIEDYVHCEVAKTLSILTVKFIAAACAILGILATGKVFFGV